MKYPQLPIKGLVHTNWTLGKRIQTPNENAAIFLHFKIMQFNIQQKHNVYSMLRLIISR